jgi:hypothetical protein
MILSINSNYFLEQLIFVMVKCCVFFAVQTKFLNIIQTSFGFKRLNCCDDYNNGVSSIHILTTNLVETCMLTSFQSVCILWPRVTNYQSLVSFFMQVRLCYSSPNKIIMLGSW